MPRTQRKGFTLIELLIIVAMIGILVSVVLVDTYRSRRAAAVSAFKTQAKSVLTSAVDLCDTAAVHSATDLRNAIDAKTGRSPLDGVEWTNAGDTAYCGPSESQTFELHVRSVKVNPACEATLYHTGAIDYSGC